MVRASRSWRYDELALASYTIDMSTPSSSAVPPGLGTNWTSEGYSFGCASGPHQPHERDPNGAIGQMVDRMQSDKLFVHVCMHVLEIGGWGGVGVASYRVP